MTWYSVRLQTDGPTIDADMLDALVDEAEASPALHGPVLGAFQDRPGISITASVEAGDASAALRQTHDAFAEIASAAGIRLGGIERAEVMTEAFQDRWLAQEPESLVGVAEIAGLFGVSRQRVAQLRSSPGFPAPAAELAAGPVWVRSSINRFLDGWHRKPGRPRTRSVARATRTAVRR
jgi:hypothetical protein